MLRRQTSELEINHERWLISYADFITLMFAFFVLMYSISQVSESKYRVLSATLTEIFDDPKRTLEPIQVGEISRSSEPQLLDASQLNLEAENQGAFEKTADLPQLSDQFTEQFSDLIDDKVIQVNSNEYWLEISMSNSLLFPIGSVKPSIEAETVLNEVAGLLIDFNNPIQVEGYTDNTPVASERYPTNWELSSARAASVVRILADNGINPTRMSAVGYGEFQPLTENETPSGRAKNRRVVLMISREKTQRPQVDTRAAIENINQKNEPESVQVNPQPGLDKSEKSLDDKLLTPRERMDLLIENNPSLGIESVLQEASPEDEEEISNEDSAIQAVETEEGGLLFSSDPELPRN